MANRSTYTQDKFLQRYAQMLTPDDGAYIAYNPLACPVLDVDTMTGNFVTVGGGFAAESPFDDMVLTDGMDKPNIIPTTISKTSGWTIQQHGLGVNVNRQSQQFAEGNGNDLRRAKTAHLMAHTRIVRERVLAALVFNATTFSGYTAAVGTGWDVAGSDPTADAMTAQDSILSNAGRKPNVAIMGHEVYRSVRSNDRILELWSRTGSSGGIVPDDAIAAALDVDRIIVGSASSNTAAEGLTESLSFIWGKFCLFAHIAQSPTPYTPQSCIQRFRFRGAGDPEIRRYALPGGYQEQIDAVYAEQFTVPTPALGYLFSSVVA